MAGYIKQEIFSAGARMKKTVLIIIFIFAVAYFTRNISARFILSSGLRAISGLNLKIEDVDIGIFKPTAEATGLELLNPADFPPGLMVDLPEFYIEYDLPALFKNKIHLNMLRLNLREFTLVRNNRGRLNIDSLKAFQAKRSGKPLKICIDILDLKISKVVYKDYSKGELPQVREFNINISERYSNITDPYTLTALIVSKALLHTTISSLADFDLKPFKSQLSGILGEAVINAASPVLGVMEGAAERIIDKATDQFERVLFK